MIDNAKAVRWLRDGAQPTETVARLLTQSGAMEEFKSGRARQPGREHRRRRSRLEARRASRTSGTTTGRSTAAGPRRCWCTWPGSSSTTRTPSAIDTGETRHGIKLSLHVAPDDMGKVIGRRGRVAQSIRSVVRAAGAKDGVDVIVDIVD